MKVNGLTIKLKVKEFIYIKMVHLILENGSTISSMGTEFRNGWMELNIKDIFMKV
jgi:hypothetical protein